MTEATPAATPQPHPEREPSAGFWRGRRVLVTGGSGFLGSHLVDQFRALGADPFVPRRAEFDLTRQADVERVFAQSAPQMVMHLAAEVGGIGANRAAPGRFFYANALMGVMMIEEARRAGVQKFVQVGTVCAYPKYTRVPFREEDLWTGYPEETNAPYGVAKKALLVQLQAYREQYGMNGIYLLPTNLYGPRDNFDEATSHVIPALVRRMVEARRAGQPTLAVWGTGNASREFLYVEDAARALLLAAEHYDGAEPVNVGIGNEIRIRELAGLIAALVGYEGALAFDPAKPDGQPRRSLDTHRALERFGFRARVAMREGLRRTVDWYLGQHPD
ncbi:GDP-L-fucose synthase [Longimicrobium sp.]|uniref:GDP-L-fucose synthase family protein n=1 Tax=Longimicrobium sp. TaxID=2029185 RepID=UPI002E364EF7|nr:GDP-L-fucose synthase [Longimicrobium sp.]HEX6036610.1 GDP-L-fucose synthase [Longimicrobium sp.]